MVGTLLSAVGTADGRDGTRASGRWPGGPRTQCLCSEIALMCRSNGHHWRTSVMSLSGKRLWNSLTSLSRS